MTRFLKVAVSYSISILLLFPPHFLSAQTDASPPIETISPQTVMVLAQATRGEGPLFGRLKPLQDRMRELEAQLRDAQTALAAQARQIEVGQQALSALASTLKTGGVLKGASDTTLGDVKDALGDGSPVLEAITRAASSVQTGSWVDGKSTQDILNAMKETRGSIEEAKRQFEARQGQINEQIARLCQGVRPRALQGLATVLPAGVPALWNAAAAVQALQADLTLPECFNQPVAGTDGRTLQTEINTHLREQQAIDRLAGAVNSMMMMAYATGNPLVIAAAFAIILLTALLGKPGGGGAEGGSEESVAENGQGENREPPDNREPVHGDGGSPNQYDNVEPGIGARVRVIGNGSTIIFQDDAGSWTVSWNPPPETVGVEGEEGRPLPAFSTNVRFLSVSIAEKNFTVRMPLPGCGGPQDVVLFAEDNILRAAPIACY